MKMTFPGMRLIMKITQIWVLILCVLMAGCSSRPVKSLKEQSAYEKIQKLLMNMETYQCEASVEYKSNKGSNTYETIQKVKSSGSYRVEVIAPDAVAGNVTMSDGSKIYQFNKKIKGKIAMSTDETQERSEIFLTNFIRNYIKSQEVSINVANMDNQTCTVMEATVPGDHPYISTEKLWVDNKTLMPVRLVIYDQQGSERILCTFKSFSYNVRIDDAEFVMETETPKTENTEKTEKK